MESRDAAGAVEDVELTGHRVQQHDTRQRPQQASSSAFPSASPLPHHPFNFSFPTLNLDGSTEHLIAHQSRRYPTPPAALSTLGAKASDADMDSASESGGSQLNEHWELVDNLSDMSHDDHDTASITSNDRDSDRGRLTPDEAGSDNDLDEEEAATVTDAALQQAIPDQPAEPPTPIAIAASFIQIPRESPRRARSSLTSSRLRQVRAENDLIDSYMSESQETPIQSTIQSPVTFRPSTAFKTLDLDDNTKRILFISDRTVQAADVDLICSKIAACMSGADADAATKHKVIRLPTSPAGIHPPSATVVCGDDSVSATVQHCIGADRRSFGSHGLRILDVDGQHSSIFTIGGDGKIDLPKPDLAVIYLDGKSNDKYSWIWSAGDAVHSVQVPVLVVYECKHDFELATHKWPKAKSERQIAIEAKDFINTNHETLTKNIEALFHPVKPAAEGKKTAAFPKKKFGWLRALSGVLLCALFFTFFRPASDPTVTLPARREALVLSLQQATNSPNITSDLNIEHLLPALPAACYSKTLLFSRGSPSPAECEIKPRFQSLLPNHFVLSLPGRGVYPEPASSRVCRPNGHLIDFNQTKLIDGIYLVTFDPDQACGLLAAHMVTQNPIMHVTVPPSHFGRCMYKRYEAASTDMSKVVSKDVAVMRTKAKHLGDKLTTELGAGLWATKNVTTQVSQYMSRELQVVSRELLVLGNTAASMFGKAAKASNQTATVFSKDLVVIQKDLVKFTKDMSSTVKSKVDLAKSGSKALIQSHLSLSRERIQGFKKAYQRKRDYKLAANQMEKAGRRSGIVVALQETREKLRKVEGLRDRLQKMRANEEMRKQQKAERDFGHWPCDEL